MGRSSTHAGFGQAYDHWEAERVKEGSAVAKLATRFNACTTDQSRSSLTTAQ